MADSVQLTNLSPSDATASDSNDLNDPFRKVAASSKYSGVHVADESDAASPFWSMTKEPGMVFGKDAGFYSRGYFHASKIITYDPYKIRSLLAPFISSDLTVCHCFTAFIGHTSMALYAFLLMLFCAAYCFPDGKWGQQPACNGDNPAFNRSMCQLEEVLSDAKSDFQFLIAFVLAGYVALSVARWKERRQNYASLCGNVRNLSLQIAAMLPIPHDGGSDTELKDAQDTGTMRKMMLRWVLLAMELSVLKARGQMDTEEAKAYLLHQELLVDGEWEVMVKGDRHTSVFFWLQTKMMNLKMEGVLDPEAFIMIATSITSIRGQANDLMSSLDRDKPFTYTALCGVLVSINVVIMSTWRGVTWALWLYALGNELWSAPKIWIDILVLLTWNISYKGLYDVGYMLHNPFGNRRIDVAHETIFAGLRRLSVELGNGNPILPPACKVK